MHITFNFRCPKCGKKLSGPVITAGQVKACPACDREITIPFQSLTKIERYLGKLPMPVPSLSIEAYRLLHDKIIAITTVASFAVSNCGLPTKKFNDCICEATQVLENIHAFTLHQIENERGIDERRGSVGGVRTIAAGNNFAGIGQSKSRNKRYRDWGIDQQPEKFSMPNSSHLSLIRASIAQLKTKRA